MLFAIDEAKVEEMLRAGDKGNGHAATMGIEPAIGNLRPWYGSSWVSGTVVINRAAISAEAREGLVAARKKIVTSGNELKSAAELSEEVEGIRGRNR